jgi:hypothetical protein
MRLVHSLTAAAMLVVGSAAVAKSNPEADLAKEIEGRVAGEPVRCISMHNLRSTRIIDNTAIVYDFGRTIYVNRPRGGADMLDQWDVLVTKPHGSQLCTPESVELYDSQTRSQSGFISLGEFVPYRKVKSARRG